MYNCKYCNKEFTKNFACTQHEKYYCKNNLDRQDKKVKSVYSNHKQAVCKYCGKSFDVACIERHEKACGNPNSKLNIKKNAYQVTHDDLNCKYCNKECKNKNSLVQHEIRCKENPDRKAYDSFGDFSITYLKGQTKETSEIVAKYANTLKERYDSGEITAWNLGKPGTWIGKHHTEESKQKIRESTIKYLENTVDNFHSRYNINACKYIDRLNEINHWHLQHAENGGEVGVCGYFLDGYDKELNIAFEYDEPGHYKNVRENILIDSDISRMRIIKNQLNCRFFRYNEKLDYLYEVTYI